MTDRGTIQARFTAALDALVEQVKEDRSILAAILCGSLSHDTVWAKSDIDLVLVTIDDKKVERSERVAVRRRRQRPRDPDAAGRVPEDRSRARCATRSCTRSSPRGGCSTRTIRRSPICAPAARDRRARHAGAAAARGAPARCRPIDKAHKWFVTRGDLDYTALWILYAATPLAQIEVIGARPAGRPRGDPAGAEAEPGVLQDDLHRPAQRARRRERPCRRRSTRSTRYMPERAPTLFAPVHRAPARGRRGAVVPRDRRPLQAQLRRRAA